MQSNVISLNGKKVDVFLEEVKSSLDHEGSVGIFIGYNKTEGTLDVLTPDDLD